MALTTEMPPNTEKRAFGRWPRLRIFLVVSANVLLALVIASALVWLAGRPGLRQRIDLTIEHENTLDENVRSIIDKLPADIQIDVFFRPFERTLAGVGPELQSRMYEILVLAEEYAPDKIQLTDHPYSPDSAKLMEEMREFGITDTNLFVVSNGDRRVAMKLLGEVAEVDLGNPSPQRGAYRPPSIVSFAGTAALVKGLLRVTQGEKPLALFSTGHGELAIFENEGKDMGRLFSLLAADGFRVERWDPSQDGAVPKECSVLAVIGATEPFSEEHVGWIQSFVDRGGSLVAAPEVLHLRKQTGSVGDLLSKFGIDVRVGLICRPVVGASGMPEYGREDCADISIAADGMRTQHDITEPLRRGDRRVRLPFGHALERGKAPPSGILLDILRTNEFTWEELPDDVIPAWIWDEGRERQGPFTMAMTSTFPLAEPSPNPVGETSVKRECRVLAVSTPYAFTNAFIQVNQDFLLNAFNWAANREYRVSIAPRRVDRRVIDLGQDRTLFYLNLIAIWALPLLCLSLGVFAAWRRRR